MQVYKDGITYLSVLVCVAVAQIIRQVGGSHDILPHFDPKVKRNVTCLAGRIAVLNCRVLDRGTRTVTWRKKDANHPLTIGEYTFTGDKRFRVDNNKRTSEWKLIIDKTAKEDSGTYICMVNTIKTHLEWTVQLNVKKLPKKPAVQVSGKKTVYRGKIIQLYCNASDDPDDVNWYRDGHLLRNSIDSGVFITKKNEKGLFISVLVIKESNMDDKGSYVCSTTNGDSDKLYVDVLNVDQENYKRGRVDAITSNGSSKFHGEANRQLGILMTLISLFLTLDKLISNCL